MTIGVWHYRPLPNAVLGKVSGIMQYIKLSLWNFIAANHCVLVIITFHYHPTAKSISAASMLVSRSRPFPCYDADNWASEASPTLGCSIEISCDIREYGSTLYVGLARAVSPTNTNFRLTFLLTRLQEALYEDLAV